MVDSWNQGADDSSGNNSNKQGFRNRLGKLGPKSELAVNSVLSSAAKSITA